MNFMDLRGAAEIYGVATLRAMSEAIWPEYEGRPWRSMANYISGEDTLGPCWAVILRNEPIGVTGWFRANYLPERSVGLRWTGIHPEYRGQERFRASVLHVINDVISTAPGIEAITELAPVAWAHRIIPAFEKLGFEVVQERHQTQGTEPLFEGAYVLTYHFKLGPECPR